MQPKIKYSLVIPAYNEEECVKPLFQEINEVMATLKEPYEVIFVDDGSKDNTFANLSQLAPIKIIKFRVNAGQTAAIDAGIKQAMGEIIITLDADGQNPPGEIPKLLDKMKNGYDVVSGWRYQRKDTFFKRFISLGANLVRKFLINEGIHDSGCTLKAYRRICFEDLDLYGEIHRFIPALLYWKGFKITEEKVEHRARTTGKTKYNYKRVLKGFIDMLSVWFWRKYSGRPLHLFGSLGIIIGGSGFLLGLFLLIGRLFRYFYLENRIWPLVAVFMVLTGIQFFISGLLADISVKTYYNDRRKVYSIEKIVDNKKNENYI